MKKTGKRKKIYAAAAIGFVLCQLVGCGSAQSDGSVQGGGSVQADGVETKVSTSGSSKFTGELEENVTIRVLENDTAIERGYFAELIAAFNETYKEYGITAVDANMDQYLDLANDGPYGYGPDVLYQANDELMRYVEGKHILPLPVQNMECFEQIPQSAWEAYKAQVDGTEYYMGVPVNIQAPVLYYRKDLLPENWEAEWDKDKNSIPDMVENWNDMYRYSLEVHSADSNKYGYMRSLYDTYFSSGFLFSYEAYIFGADNTDVEDIGFSKGEAEKGAWVLRQLASAMNEECIDNTITQNCYSKMAAGNYFATITTPDVYTTFIKEMVLVYKEEGLSEEEARKRAEENLVIAEVPKLPESGDLSEENPVLKDSKTMGGINGYAISTYTKAPNACLAFVEFAASYDNMIKRNEYLGIAPARKDAAAQLGGLSEDLFEKLEQGNIIAMPSIKEVKQIWTPCETFFSDVAKDPFRTSDRKYETLESLKEGLRTVDSQIYDAIHTLTE